MNGTIQIPVELSYDVVGAAAGGGGVTMTHLFFLVIAAALVMVVIMIMQANARSEKQDILRTVEKQESERQWKDNLKDTISELRGELNSEKLKRRGAEDKVNFTRNKVGA